MDFYASVENLEGAEICTMQIFKLGIYCNTNNTIDYQIDENGTSTRRSHPSSIQPTSAIISDNGRRKPTMMLPHRGRSSWEVEYWMSGHERCSTGWFILRKSNYCSLGNSEGKGARDKTIRRMTSRST